jgi:hypothetical protein
MRCHPSLVFFGYSSSQIRATPLVTFIIIIIIMLINQSNTTGDFGTKALPSSCFSFAD